MENSRRNFEGNGSPLGAGVSDFDEAAKFPLVVGKPVRSRIELVAVRVGNGGDHLPAHPLESAVGQPVENQRDGDQDSGAHAARSSLNSATGSASTVSRCSGGMRLRSSHPCTVV